jgi:hypothetical protein
MFPPPINAHQFSKADKHGPPQLRLLSPVSVITTCACNLSQTLDAEKQGGLTINIILPTTFQHIYWYTIRVSAIRWPSAVVVKNVLYGSLFVNTMCVIIQ